jgi:hypothetical protein
MRGLATIALLVALAHAATARQLLGGAATTQTVNVVMFADNDLADDHQTFTAKVPLPAAGKAPGTTCSPCVEFNYLRTNSWESWIADGGFSVTFFDGHGCSGDSKTLPDRTRDTAQVKAVMSGNIGGRLEDSVDSMRVCI